MSFSLDLADGSPDNSGLGCLVVKYNNRTICGRLEQSYQTKQLRMRLTAVNILSRVKFQHVIKCLTG